MLDEVGPDAARLTYLLQSIDSPQTFDIDVVTSEGNGQPGLLRADGLRPHPVDQAGGRRARRRRACPSPRSTSALLVHERELEVLRALSSCPRWWPLRPRERAPHKITTWVRELAGAVHGFYHDCYVLGEGVSPELTQARLWLVEAAEIGLAIGLDLLGVSAPESM